MMLMKTAVESAVSHVTYEPNVSSVTWSGIRIVFSSVTTVNTTDLQRQLEEKYGFKDVSIQITLPLSNDPSQTGQMLITCARNRIVPPWSVRLTQRQFLALLLALFMFNMWATAQVYSVVAPECSKTIKLLRGPDWLSPARWFGSPAVNNPNLKGRKPKPAPTAAAPAGTATTATPQTPQKPPTETTASVSSTAAAGANVKKNDTEAELATTAAAEEDYNEDVADAEEEEENIPPPPPTPAGKLRPPRRTREDL